MKSPKEFVIVRSHKSMLGASYTLFEGKRKITTHYCSCDGFAHGDLYSHEETKDTIGPMTKEEFSKIKIIEEELLDVKNILNGPDMNYDLHELMVHLFHLGRTRRFFPDDYCSNLVTKFLRKYDEKQNS